MSNGKEEMHWNGWYFWKQSCFLNKALLLSLFSATNKNRSRDLMFLVQVTGQLLWLLVLTFPRMPFCLIPAFCLFIFFILFARNILSIIRKYFPLAIFYETLKVEKRNRRKILTCHYRVDFKYIILHSLLCWC